MTRKFIIIVGVALLVGLFMGWRVSQNSGPGELDDFAMCLKDKGATFYGAFWCPHCQSQKALFAKSAKLLPYVECATPDGQGQFPICKEKKITGYPTWVFADGTSENGELTLRRLSDKTGCLLPQNTKSDMSTTTTATSTATSTPIELQ